MSLLPDLPRGIPPNPIRIEGWGWMRLDTVVACVYGAYAIGVFMFLLTGAPQ